MLMMLRLVGLKWHPKCGASWEGFIVREIIRCCGAERNDEGEPWPLSAGITAVPAHCLLATVAWLPE